MDAARSGVSSIIDMLIEAGADPNYYSTWSYQTALSVASDQGHNEAVSKIQDYLEAFAVSLDREGSATLVDTSEPEVSVEALTKRTTRQKNLTEASGSGLIAAISRIIFSGTQDSGDALLKAASMGQDAAVTMLLDHGANIEVCDEYGYQSIHLAAKAGYTSTVKLLHKAGAHSQVDWSASSDGRTPLSLAASGGHVETVNVLLQFGASTDMKDHFLRTVLYHAVVQGNVSIVETLTSHGANSINTATTLIHFSTRPS